MRLFAAAAAGLATLLCLVSLANAGVVKRAEHYAAAATYSEDAHPLNSPTAISQRGRLDDPQCCMPGCNYCSPQTCSSSNCERNVIYTVCCADSFLLANAIFVDEIEETSPVPELDVTDVPTPTAVADSAEPVEVRQVQGLKPTPFCCQPGCMTCSPYTCFGGKCPWQYSTCCADSFLLAKATFVSDIEASSVILNSGLTAPKGQGASVNARQLSDPDLPHVYGGAGPEDYLAIMADVVESPEANDNDDRGSQQTGEYGGGGHIGNSFLAPETAIQARDTTASDPQQYGGGGYGYHTIIAGAAVQPRDTTASDPQQYGGGGYGYHTIIAGAAVQPREATASDPDQYGGGGYGYHTIIAGAAVQPRETTASDPDQYGGGGYGYHTIIAGAV